MPFDPQRLLEPAVLAPRLAAPDAPLVVDVGAPERYAAAHLPGAVLVTPMELVDGRPPAAGRLPDADRLAELATRLGLAPEREVVVYDDEGGGWAGRLAWTLTVLGHERWAYLDGGLQAWHAAGLPLTREPGAPTPRPQPVTIHRDAIAETEDVLAALEDPHAVIWDARSPEEYAGRRRTAPRAGHVPGARNLEWTELMDPERALRLRRDAAERIRAAGIDLDRTVITHCHSHHRSGLTWLVATLLGAPRVRAYHGSWSEWGFRDDVPVATGDEP